MRLCDHTNICLSERQRVGLQTMQPQIRQREHVSNFGSADDEGFQFKSSSDDEETGANVVYPDLYKRHKIVEEEESKLYRCWCVVLLTVPRALDPFASFPPFLSNLSCHYHTNPLIAIHCHANQYTSCCCIYARGDCACDEDEDDENDDVTKHSGPALGLPVLSDCVPVLGQAYMALWVWVSFYGLWTVLGRELSETGPIFKPMLFLFLRNIFSTILLVMLVLMSEGCRIRSLRPRRRDACLALALGAAIWINQLLYIYGLRFTTATNAALLEACIPVYAMVIGLLIGSQVWGKGCNCIKKVLGLTFCTGGAIFVILASDRAQGHLNLPHSRHLYGNVLLWMSTVRCNILFLFKKARAQCLFFKITGAYFFL